MKWSCLLTAFLTSCRAAVIDILESPNAPAAVKCT